MPTKRVAQVNALIRDELSRLLARELEFPAGCLATLSRVETSADLEYSKIWVKVYPSQYTQKVLEILNRNLKEIRQLLSQRLIMRVMPKIKFYHDTSEERAARIDELINEIHKKDG